MKWAGDQPTRRNGNGTLWTYDSAGNMTGKESYINSVSQGLITSTFDLSNRLLTMGSKTYSNDSAGNRVGKIDTDNWAYIYDGENRLTQVNKNGATVLQNAYDGSGMRVKKIEGGKTVYFVYNGFDPVLEYSATDAKYTYYIYAGKQSIAEETNSVVKFYHKDHLGSTRVTTGPSGNVVTSYTYEPFGKVIWEGDGGQKFTGKEQDATGLYYFGARFYDPEVGRFITPDTYTNLPNDERISFIVYSLNKISYINDGESKCGWIVF